MSARAEPHTRPRALVAALAACAAPPLLAPSAAGRADLLACLAWLSWIALPVGLLAGRRGAGVGVFLGAAVAWSLAVGVAVGVGPRRQPEPDLVRALCGLAVPLGLLALGLGLGAARPARAAWWAHLAAIAVLALCGLPVGVGLLPTVSGAGLAARSPAAASRLLDLSPLTLAAESAGVDWTRHPAVYEPAGTDWFSGSRRPYSGASGALALLVGAVAGAAARRLGNPARRDPPTGPSDARP